MKNYEAQTRKNEAFLDAYWALCAEHKLQLMPTCELKPSTHDPVFVVPFTTPASPHAPRIWADAQSIEECIEL